MLSACVGSIEISRLKRELCFCLHLTVHGNVFLKQESVAHAVSLRWFDRDLSTETRIVLLFGHGPWKCLSKAGKQWKVLGSMGDSDVTPERNLTGCATRDAPRGMRHNCCHIKPMRGVLTHVRSSANEGSGVMVHKCVGTSSVFRISSEKKLHARYSMEHCAARLVT